VGRPGHAVVVDPVVDLLLVLLGADDRLGDHDRDADQRDHEEGLAPSAHTENQRDQGAGGELAERESGVVDADGEAAVLAGPPFADQGDVDRLRTAAADAHRNAQQQEGQEHAGESVGQGTADRAQGHCDDPGPGAPVARSDAVGDPAEEDGTDNGATKEDGVDQAGFGVCESELVDDRGEHRGENAPVDGRHENGKSGNEKNPPASRRGMRQH